MDIIPFTSVGILKFGDTRSEARQKLASMFSTFEKVVGENETDSFDGLGLHLYYSDSGGLEFVEAFDPAQLKFRGINFMGRDLEVVTQEMKSIGFDTLESDVGIKFPEVGIALTAPDRIIEGIATYCKGYYD